MASCPGGVPRLKREDCHRTKHDSAFTQWQILIGPSDWSDYLKGKQGAERYRVQNLPSSHGPGLYEIGVAVCPTGSGREVAKLDPHDMVVVYLGEADNVRSRLQRYGRGGSHLENAGGCPSIGSGLFRDVFSRGYPIVYRWAPMNSKIDAKRAEAQLLGRFDYAWNKLENGSRRPSDVLQKIDKISSQTFQLPIFFKRLQALRHKQVGIPIKPTPCLPHDQEDNGGDITHKDKDKDEETRGFLAQVFKLARSRPRLVFNRPSISEDKSIAFSTCVTSASKNSHHHDPHCCYAEEKCRFKSPDAISCDNDIESPLVCGVILLDGSPCTAKPLRGRKRCEQHKGRRITQPTISSRYLINNTTSGEPAASVISSSSSVVMVSREACYCALILSDGSYCKRRPVRGRKRCEEHKGMRVRGLVAKLSCSAHNL